MQFLLMFCLDQFEAEEGCNPIRFKIYKIIVKALPFLIKVISNLNCNPVNFCLSFNCFYSKHTYFIANHLSPNNYKSKFKFAIFEPFLISRLCSFTECFLVNQCLEFSLK
jgi:hypothetical protein